MRPRKAVKNQPTPMPTPMPKPMPIPMPAYVYGPNLSSPTLPWYFDAKAKAKIKPKNNPSPNQNPTTKRGRCRAKDNTPSIKSK